MRFTKDGKMLASVGDDNVARIWSAQTGKLINEFIVENTYSIEWSPDSTTLATAGFYNILFWSNLSTKVSNIM
jgi:WD40 repeat protein